MSESEGVSEKNPSLNDSSSENQTLLEKIYVDNTDQIVLKATLDGAIEKYFTDVAKVEPVQKHSNIFLASAFISVVITLLVQFNLVKTPKTLLIGTFFALQGFMALYKMFIQKNDVFVGKIKEGVFQVSTTLPSYELDYTITFTRGKNIVTKPTQVSSFFTANGLFLKDHFYSVLAEAFESLNTRKNQ